MNHSIARWALWPLALALSACGGSGDEGKVAERAAARTTSDAAANPSATSASAAAGGFDFATWVAANAACKGEYFADVQDPAFAHTLSAAGIEVSADSTIGEVGPGGGSLTPRAPTRLHGLPIVRVDYDFGSGSTPMPDIQFVRDGDKPGTQEIGCAAFDM
ncbi:MAG: hypothetical protein JF591_21580 [Lysobacter sp.]|nr:hypothetical protein [Lysobacter sp.]